jgi:hypothetical protein
MMQPANDQSVCFALGQYLATGHGAFTGFASRPNIIWVNGGDMFPDNGSEGALRALQVLLGMQAGGDTHLSTSHWQHDYLTPDQTDFLPYIGIHGAYTHGGYPWLGPTYAESRALYSLPQTQPTFLIETTYWGEHGAARADIRDYSWGSAFSGIAGTTFGFSPLWVFTMSPDGTTWGTAWVPNTSYLLNSYVSKAGSWYRATTAGTTGTTGPSGTGAAITDGDVVWTYVGSGDWSALLGEPGVLDFQNMGAFLDAIPWQKLVPSGLGGVKTLVTAGQGSYAAWRDTASGEGGGMEWIVAAAAPDGSLLTAYVPDAHAGDGAFGIDMTALRGSSRARWYDPTNGTFQADVSGDGYVLPNSGQQSFTIPGLNAAGDADWVLIIDSP